MSLVIYNTQTRQKEEFEPLAPGRVSMYVCGVTVYDSPHIGHARCYVAFDAIHRHLRSKGWQVTYVRNFTDIDDKIIKRASETGQDWRDLTQENIEAFTRAMQALKVLPASHEPRATEHIGGIISAVEALIEKGHAYPVEGGDVLFAVDSFPEYGKLSHRELDQMQAGARIAVDERKKNPMDFVLWKGSKPGEPSWDSPWGPGRPGWHIECSVMSQEYLGATFDIHGGGEDLLFPHHENEVAQSEALNGQPFARYWIHNGFVQGEPREDVQVPGQLLHRGRHSQNREARGAPAVPVVQALPLAPGFQRSGHQGGGAGLGDGSIWPCARPPRRRTRHFPSVSPGPRSWSG